MENIIEFVRTNVFDISVYTGVIQGDYIRRVEDGKLKDMAFHKDTVAILPAIEEKKK